MPPRIPSRSTKTSEKLVLLPESVEEVDEKEGLADGEDDDGGPPKDGAPLRRAGTEKLKSYAERLPKSKRTEKDLARVTAYCTAQAYKMQSTAAFIRETHGARAKLYDDCLYCAYHLPLVPGHDGYRVRSSPALKGVGGKIFLDEAIARNEQRDHRGYMAEYEDEHSVGGMESPHDANEAISNGADGDVQERAQERRNSNSSLTDPTIPTDAFAFAEMYVFSYGVVVFWNFTERQEKDILADLTFSSRVDAKTKLSTPLVLATNPLEEEDFETEEFHFEYNTEIPRPRLFNDMITLRSGDHMIKLAISHAIAQSTKLSFFEENMATQMEEAKDVPKRLALTGELGMKRNDVVKILGGLFKSRVDVNLSSNVLDVPNLIWDDEPTLHPLYTAVREYLEIKPRIQVLNERCRVFLDLAEILSDFIDDSKMSKLTWIIIVLICVSIVVTCTEVFLRFGILETRGGGKQDADAAHMFLRHQSL